MRREGRQHGLVRSVITSSTRNRVVNRFDSLPTAGIFQKVPCKPTNHSKFTGPMSYAGYRALPATKSRGKAKGNHKLKCNDVSMNQKLIAWRVMDKQRQSNYIGLSATEILDGLLRDDPNEYDEYHLEEEEGDEFNDEIALNDGEIEAPNVVDVDHAVAGGSGELFDVHDYGDDDDDYDLVFYNVEIDYENEGEEGWYLVDEETC
ncbi:hypothetical protein EJ110_NYTH03492 [Nymphaea thermarum]|nr:hypothetical protein EJ110_NYTH03492 [Nymphaea thermarum]